MYAENGATPSSDGFNARPLPKEVRFSGFKYIKGGKDFTI